jgi:hypothetical protein
MAFSGDRPGTSNDEESMPVAKEGDGKRKQSDDDSDEAKREMNHTSLVSMLAHRPQINERTDGGTGGGC